MQRHLSLRGETSHHGRETTITQQRSHSIDEEPVTAFNNMIHPPPPEKIITKTRKMGPRSITVSDCRAENLIKDQECLNRRSSSVDHALDDHRNPDEDDDDESRKKTSMGSKAWDTTEKVLGVHTVLGTAGLTSTTFMAVPSFRWGSGGWVCRGCYGRGHRR